MDHGSLRSHCFLSLGKDVLGRHASWLPSVLQLLLGHFLVGVGAKVTTDPYPGHLFREPKGGCLNRRSNHSGTGGPVQREIEAPLFQDLNLMAR